MQDKVLYIDDALTFAIMAKGGEPVDVSTKANDDRARKCIRHLIDLNPAHERYADYLKQFLEVYGRFFACGELSVDKARISFDVGRGLPNFFGTKVSRGELRDGLLIEAADEKVYLVPVSKSDFPARGVTRDALATDPSVMGALESLLFVARIGAEARGVVSPLPDGRIDAYDFFSPTTMSMMEHGLIDGYAVERMEADGVDPLSRYGGADHAAFGFYPYDGGPFAQMLYDDMLLTGGALPIPFSIEGGGVDAHILDVWTSNGYKVVLTGGISDPAEPTHIHTVGDLDGAAQRRLAASALFQYIASKVLPPLVTVDAESLAMKGGGRLDGLLAHAVACVLDASGDSKLATCPWCGRPVMNRNGVYCKHGGCRTEYNRAAQRHLRANGLDAAADMFPAIKRETMEGWIAKDTDFAGNGVRI